MVISFFTRSVSDGGGHKDMGSGLQVYEHVVTGNVCGRSNSCAFNMNRCKSNVLALGLNITKYIGIGMLGL